MSSSLPVITFCDSRCCCVIVRDSCNTVSVFNLVSKPFSFSFVSMPDVCFVLEVDMVEVAIRLDSVTTGEWAGCGDFCAVRTVSAADV